MDRRLAIGAGAVFALAAGALFAAHKRGASSGPMPQGSGDLGRPTSRKLEDLDPSVAGRVRLVISDLEADGYAVYVYETRRSEARAEHLKRAGFSKAGKASRHVPGKAADLVDGRRDAAGDLVLWGASTGKGVDAQRTAMARGFFAALGRAAKRRGLEWGGDWSSFPDPAHIQG